MSPDVLLDILPKTIALFVPAAAAFFCLRMMIRVRGSAALAALMTALMSMVALAGIAPWALGPEPAPIPALVLALISVAYAGPLWFRGLLVAAEEEVGDALAGGIIDCGPHPGLVMESLELGLTFIRFTGPTTVAGKLAALAEARGAQVITGELTAFDSLDKDPLQADLEAWLRAVC